MNDTMIRADRPSPSNNLLGARLVIKHMHDIWNRYELLML